MFVKLTPTSGWTFNDPTAELVKVARRGLVGADRAALVKRAGAQAADWIDRLEPLPGEPLVHLIALGCTEKHSANRNGDGFKAAACRKYHDTFRKHARLFLDHQNSDPSKSYGIVKASWFNEPMGRIELIVGVNETKQAAQRNGGMVDFRFLPRVEKNAGDAAVSMACIPDPDAPVLTSEGYRPIRAVQVGDLVYTHEKRWKRVTELKRRPYTGKSVRVRMKGLATPVWMTADHPMYAAVLAHEPALTAGQRPVQRWSQRSERDGVPGFDWQCAGHLSEGDRMCVAPITSSPDGVGIESEDLAALLGIYTAEGSLGYNGEMASTVSLTVHVDDWAVTAVPELIRRLASDVSVKLTPKKASKFSMDMRIHSTELARWCEHLVGRRCENKRVPLRLFSSSENIKLAYIGRWLDGDGFCDVKGVHWSTSNLNLALQLRDLLLSCDIGASIYKITHKAKRGIIETKEPGIEYTVNISNFDSHRLSAYSEKAAANPFAKDPEADQTRKKQPCLYKTGGLYSYVVSEVETEDLVDHTVYNFEVEDDHSYSLYGLTSHNCTIPFDVCSSCGNKAASRKYYCTGDTCPHGGCRDNLTKVSEDGHMLHVDNPDPKWFDISDVGTPADRIAYAFGRVGAGNTKSAAFDSGVAPSVLLPTWNTPGLDAHDRRRLVLAKLAALEDELLTTPPDAVDVGYARAADLARCPVTPDAWGRKHYPGNTVKWARLAGSAKTAFTRLLAKPEVFEAPPETKYANSNPLAESDVIRQAAMAAITKVGAHRPLVGDPFADQLAWHQVAWAAAGRTADEVERRVEAVVRLNRAA